MIFVWRSELLKQYGTGYLIAEAQTRAEAEEKVRSHFTTWSKDQWWGELEDREEEAERLEKLDLDLAKDPDVLGGEAAVLYINGSE